MSRKNCCAAVMGLVQGLVAPGRLVNVPVLAGADVFSKQSDGSTVASQYARLGVSLRCANTERVSGWAEILHRLGDPANGVAPRLFIHERCARLIETLPALQHDPNRPEGAQGGHG